MYRDGVLCDTTLHPAVRLLAQARTLRDPLLIVAFAGAYGGTGAAAVQHLAEQWRAEPLAEIDPDPFYDFTVQRPAVRLEDGRRVIDWPAPRLLLASPPGAGRDLVLLVGIEPHLRWREFCEAVASVARLLGVASALTVNAFRGPVPHTRPAPVRLYGEEGPLAASIGVPPQASHYEGPVGIGSVLAEHLRGEGLEVASISALGPFYMRVEPEPHAMLALVETLDRTFAGSTDRELLHARVREVDEQARQAMARSEDFREFLEQLEQQFDQAAGQEHAAAQAAKLDAEGVVRDVEDFLRRHRGLSDPGKPSRNRQP